MHMSMLETQEGEWMSQMAPETAHTPGLLDKTRMAIKLPENAQKYFKLDDSRVAVIIAVQKVVVVLVGLSSSWLWSWSLRWTSSWL